MTRHHPFLYEVRFFGTFVQRFRAVPSTFLARDMIPPASWMMSAGKSVNLEELRTVFFRICKGLLVLS